MRQTERAARIVYARQRRVHRNARAALNLRVPEELKKRYVKACARAGSTQSDIMRQLMDRFCIEVTQSRLR